MNTFPTLIFWLTLGLLAYWLTTTIFSILAARIHFELSRHNLLVKSQQMRLEYLSTIDERMAGVIEDEHSNVVIEEDDEPSNQAA